MTQLHDHPDGEVSLFDRMLAASPIIIFRETLPDRIVTYASPNFGEVLGYAADDVVGTSGFFGRLMDEASGERFVRSLEAVAAGSVIGEEEYEITLATGERRWFVIAVRLDGGSQKAVLGYAADVTARVLSDQATRQLTERYRAIFEGVPSGIFRSSPDGTILEANPALARIFGYDSPEELKNEVRDVGSLYLDRRDRLRFIKLVIDSQAIQNFETKLRRRDGKVIDISMNASIVRDQAGEILGFEGTLLDVTDQRMAEEEARQARAEADRANQAKSAFLSRMSHELRTPLNSILGFAQLLELRDLEPSVADSVQHILNGGRHLLELINEVLDIARVESGRLAMSLEPVHAAEVILEAISLIAPLATTRGVEVGLDPEPCHEFVYADRQRIKQVLLNLLANAVKYNRSGGEVRVHCRRDDGHLTISVSDTGAGISLQHLERLFTPFDRLGAEASGEEGTGLGLVLSRHLTEAMGGTLTASSNVGAGSTFAVTLTVVAPPGERGVLTSDAALQLNRTQTEPPASTVLYIEDNLANLTLVEEIFTLRPHIKLERAMQGRLGLRLAQSSLPDLVLLDVNLPDISGREVLHELRLDPRTASIPVLMISADASPGQIKRLLEEGAIGYMTKPLDIYQFLTEVDRILAR